MARPACKWKSMWQWRNHGPGLSVCAAPQSGSTDIGDRKTYHEAHGHVIAPDADADRVALHWVDVVVVGAASAAYDGEGVLQGSASACGTQMPGRP